MKPNTPPLERVAVIVGSALGLGLSPVLPGTCGALLGVAIHAGVVLALPAHLHLMILTLAFVAVCAANYLLTGWAEAYWNEPDPRHFVLDEVAGYLFVPMLFREGELWRVALAGFVLFRVFDIFKLIPPARQVDRELHGPWGVLLDDLVSAGYAALVLHLVYWFGPAGLLGPAV